MESRIIKLINQLARRISHLTQPICILAICSGGRTVGQYIYKYLKECQIIYARNEENTRRFVEAVLWMARSGSQWRFLSKEYGDWNTVYKGI